MLHTTWHTRCCSLVLPQALKDGFHIGFFGHAKFWSRLQYETLPLAPKVARRLQSLDVTQQLLAPSLTFWRSAQLQVDHVFGSKVIYDLPSDTSDGLMIGGYSMYYVK